MKKDSKSNRAVSVGKLDFGLLLATIALMTEFIPRGNSRPTKEPIRRRYTDVYEVTQSSWNFLGPVLDLTKAGERLEKNSTNDDRSLFRQTLFTFSYINRILKAFAVGLFKFGAKLRRLVIDMF